MNLPPTQLLTERLRLSAWQDEHAAALRAVLDRCDAHLRPWIPFMQNEPRTLQETRVGLADVRAAFARGEHFRYAITERRSNELVGETMLLGRGGEGTLEAGYWLDERHCGKGYATEATRALLPLAFEQLAVASVILRCDAQNHASVQVAKRLGGTRCGQEVVEENGGSVTLLVFECRPIGYDGKQQ